MSIESELADGLVATGKENVDKGRDAEESVRAIAKVIADAIKKGVYVSFKGSATCQEITAMTDMSVGDIYAVSDSGTIVNADGTTLVCDKNDFVVYAGDSWTKFFRIDLDGYVNTITPSSSPQFSSDTTIVVGKEDNAMLTSTASALWAYIKSSMVNDTAVNISGNAVTSGTASKVSGSLGFGDKTYNGSSDVVITSADLGVDDKFEAKEDAKSKANSYGLLMRANGTNTLQFYRPSIT